jgi:ATP-dependent Lon protease
VNINLQGKVTAIGGLDLKILGGIRAGVKTSYFQKIIKKIIINLLKNIRIKTLFLTMLHLHL